MTRALAILLLLAFDAQARPKTERKPRRYAVRAIRVGGNASDEDKTALVRALGNAIEFVIAGSNRDDLVRGEEVEAAHPTLKGCLLPRCSREFGDLVRADRLLWIEVTRAGPPGPKADWKLEVSQFAVDSLRNLGTAELPCRNCTRDELVGNANVFLDPLFQSEPAPLPLCTLTVDSDPPGAAVLLDKVVIGEAPFRHTISAGSHRIAVEKEGFARGESVLECAPLASEKLLFAITPSLGHALVAAPEAPHRSLLLPIIGGGLLALGAAGIVAGAVSLSYDGQGTCKLAAGHTQCKELYATGSQGAALIGAGAAAAVGGVIALVVDAVRRRPARVSAEVRASAASVSLGVKGSF